MFLLKRDAENKKAISEMQEVGTELFLFDFVAAFEHVRDGRPETTREPLEIDEGWVPEPPLDHADVGSVETTDLSKFFLCQTERSADAPHPDAKVD